MCLVVDVERVLTGGPRNSLHVSQVVSRAYDGITPVIKPDGPIHGHQTMRQRKESHWFVEHRVASISLVFEDEVVNVDV